MKWLTLTEIREFFTKGHERSVSQKEYFGIFYRQGGKYINKFTIGPTHVELLESCQIWYMDYSYFSDCMVWLL